MDSRPLVSVIIPSRNRSRDLELCLRSLERQDYPNVEVIVVDDHSTDDTAEMIARLFPSVKFSENKCEHGPSYLRNQGIVRARGEYLLLLDSDSELPRTDSISTLVHSIQLRRTIGCIGGEIPVYRNIRDRAFGRSVLFRGTTKAVTALPHGANENGIVPCDYLASCGCFVRKETAVRAGGFDPHYGFGGEDLDFGMQIQKLGYENCVLFEAAVLHHKSLTARHPNEMYLYQRARIRFTWKNRTIAHIAVVTALDFLDIVTFYPLLPVKLITKLVLRRPIENGSFTGALVLLRGYFWNLQRLGETRKASRKNFLENSEMASFLEDSMRLALSKTV